MNIAKLNSAIENVRNTAGNGLIAMDIWGKADGIPIAGHNSQPQAAALMNSIYSRLIAALSGSGFPSDLSDYLLRIADGKVCLCGIIGDDYIYGMLMDTKQIQYGLVINVIAPTFVREAGDALK